MSDRRRYVEWNGFQHKLMLDDIVDRILSAKTAFNVLSENSMQTDDRDYLEEVGRMTLEILQSYRRI